MLFTFFFSVEATNLQGHLVKIETLEENEELYREVVRLQMTNITTSPWIGLNDISTNPNPIDEWVWTDGSRPNFTNWYRVHHNCNGNSHDKDIDNGNDKDHDCRNCKNLEIVAQ